MKTEFFNLVEPNSFFVADTAILIEYTIQLIYNTKPQTRITTYEAYAVRFQYCFNKNIMLLPPIQLDKKVETRQSVDSNITIELTRDN